MVNSLSLSVASTLFGSSTDTSTGVGADLLTAWASARAGVGADKSTAGQDPNAPAAPVWKPGISPSDADLVTRALSGKAFFDTKAKLYSDLGAQGDYKRLFALYTGIDTLQALASQLDDESISKTKSAQVQDEITRGLAELQSFFANEKFEDIRVAQGDRLDETQTTLAVQRATEDYVTAPVHKGSLAATVTGLDPNAAFDIVAVTPGGTKRTVSIDLSQMGSIPRSLSNVLSFINNKLTTAGVSTRLLADDQTPKTTTVKIGGKSVEQRYTGQKIYGLKVDVRAGETVSFTPASPDPAFYVVGDTAAGARLIKIADVADEPGQPVWLDRPSATADPIGPDVATGWFGPGAPYGSAPADATETRTNSLVSDGANNFETALRKAGDATLKLQLADGRTISVSTSWRSDDLEAWRVKSGEDEDKAILNDLAERLTQLLHEQGVAAGVDVWESGAEGGFSIFTDDLVKASSFTISGRDAALETIDPSSIVGGLREGVYARRFEVDTGVAVGANFSGAFDLVLSGASGSTSISISNGAPGVSAATLVSQINDKLHDKGFAAKVDLVDSGGTYALQVDGLHDLTGGTLEYATHDFTLARVAPGAEVLGGLPQSAAGQPFADAVRTYNVAGGSPLLTETGALDIDIAFDTPAGAKTVSVAVTAQERIDNPDTSPGEWAQIFQDRVNDALNAAGIYGASLGTDLTQWAVAEDSSQRISSITINGNALSLSSSTPTLGLGGAFTVERSFTSANAATGTADDVASLLSDQNVSITFGTVWGEKTVTAALQIGDPATLESAALRLNEALAAEGYDLGVEAVDLSGGGAGLRLVSGASHTIRNVSNISLGGTDVAASLDPIDSTSSADDPVGAARVANRATRGAAVTETVASLNTILAPSANSSAWFAGRSFDVAVGGTAKVATARQVATTADGAVYVVADLVDGSSTTPVKGVRDVALLKYDSAGHLLFTRQLGAADTASGFALATSADGKVAVAGSVTGVLAGAGQDKGGADSLVAVFDSSGEELWTSRRGASADDRINSIAFAPDGSLIVAGQTASAIGATSAIGGGDAYIRGFNATGLATFTRQFGTTAADAATALLVRDDGAGGVDIFTGGVENNRGVLRAFNYSSSAGLSVGATRDIGNFHGGAITSLGVDGGALYVGGAVGTDRLTLSGVGRPGVAGLDGFVARVSDNLLSNSLDRATYIGGSGDDKVTGLVVNGSDVYAVGAGAGVVAGQSTVGKSAFIARLASDGDIDWTRAFTSAGGAVAVNAVAVAPAGASALDALGLPSGKLSAVNSTTLVNNSALRAGDELRVGELGRRLSTVTITATDTMSSLLTKLNRSLGTAGRADLVRENGVDRIRITSYAGKAAVIESGREGKDALAGLGLHPGVIAKNTNSKGEKHTYGLGILSNELKFDTKGNRAKAKAELSAAISIVRQAYDALLNPHAKEQTAEEKALADKKAAAGAAPAYYTSQLANYKAALARLGG